MKESVGINAAIFPKIMTIILGKSFTNLNIWGKINKLKYNLYHTGFFRVIMDKMEGAKAEWKRK